MSEEVLAPKCTGDWHKQLMGAVARGWCHTQNEHKQMDPDLALAIVEEVEAILSYRKDVA